MTRPNNPEPQGRQETVNVPPPLRPTVGGEVKPAEEPQIVLSTKDYQEYLTDRIAQKLFLKILAVASIATTLLAALLIWNMNIQVNNAVKEESKDIRSNLGSNISKEIANTLSMGKNHSDG
jgi:hypothetical protein